MYCTISCGYVNIMYLYILVFFFYSGDKDFLPALLRTRQKGRKVAIVAMRAGCNRALYETPNVKDYNVIWIDDYLDQLIVPRMNTPNKSPISTFTISKVIYDFITTIGIATSVVS